MKQITKRLLALLLMLAMVISLLPAIAFAAEDKMPQVDYITADEDALVEADVINDIDSYFTASTKRDGELTLADYVAATADLKALVMSSDTYVEDSLVERGDGFFWQTTAGITCGYFPKDRYEADQRVAVKSVNTSSLAAWDYSKATDKDVCLVAPMYSEDTTFTDQYVKEAVAIAEALGGTAYGLIDTEASVTAIGQAIEKCGVVIFDSHGNTDWGYFDGGSDGEGTADCVSEANTSYLCLSTGSGMTTADCAYNSGTFGSYPHAYKDSYGNYVADGTAFANHMNGNAPNSLLWMAICLGMATDGMCKPLREKGVAVVYGYSQSVTFDGDYLYEETFWDNMMNGATVASAVADMKATYGNWDYSTQMTYYGYATIAEARENYAAFPVVVSDVDAYPGQRYYSSNYGACSLQTVKSTYTLFSNYNITATSNNTAWGTVSVNGKTITAIPANGYYAAGATVTSGTATVTQNGNTFTVNAESDCTVEITFAQKTAVTVSFSGAGGITPLTGYAGDELTLPTVTAPEGYTFLGWTTAEVTEATTEEPVYFTVYTPTASTTLYALYSYVDDSGTGTGDYVKVTTAPSDWSGEYLIVYEAGNLIFDGSLSSFDAVSNYKNVTISDSTIAAAEGDPYKFTIATLDSSYSIQGTSGKYIGRSSTSNGLDTSATAVPNAISMNSDGTVNIIGSSGNYLRYNKTSGQTRFRYFKASTYTDQQAICLYMKDGIAGTVYYTGTTASCEHNWVAGTVVAPTCEAPGYTEYSCSLCGDTKQDDAIDALGHSYGDWISDNAGKHSQTCTNCSNTVTVSCSYTEAVTPPSETEDGYTTFTCSDCGYSYTGAYTPALGSALVVSFSVPAGVTAPAAQSAYAGQSITLPVPETLPAGDYTFAGWTDAAVENTTEAPTIYTGEYAVSETTTLYAVYTYTVAGTGSSDYVLTDIANISDTDSVVVTMSHSGTVYVLSNNNGTSKAPTATVVKVSGNKLENIPDATILWNIGSDASGYIFYPEGTTTTWLYCISENNGVRVGTNSAKTFTIDANSGYLVHSGTSRYIGVYTNNPDWRCYTSINTNIKGQTLGFYVKGQGGATYYTTIIGSTSACDHSNTTTTTVNPTCTVPGSTTETCDDCGTVVNTTVIEASGHSYGDGLVTAPTCTEDGYTTYTCTVCGESYTDSITSATGHSYVDGTCTVCGETEPAEADYSGRYYLAGKRSGDTYYQYILGELNGSRYAIQDSGLTSLPAEITDADSNKVFVIEKNTDGSYSLYAEGIADEYKYLGWTSGNSGEFVSASNALSLTIDKLDSGKYNIYFYSTGDSQNRYLSFNSTAGNRYAAWYKSGQLSDLTLIPVITAVQTHTHTPAYFEGQAADCETEGVKAYWYCADEACPEYGTCYEDEAFTTTISADDLIIEALGHNMVAVNTVAPTCTEEGYTEYCCSRCDATDLDDIVDALGHDMIYSDNEDGTHTYGCSRECEVEDVIEDHVYVDGSCPCGAPETVEPTELELKFYHSMSFDADLKVNYRFAFDEIEAVIPNYVLEGAYLELEKDRYTSGGEKTVDETTVTYTVDEAANRLVFSVVGIQSVEMGSELRAVLHIFDSEGKEYVTQVDTYSVLAYVTNNLAKNDGKNNEFCTLLVDALNYGAAAQIFFDRRTDELVNAGIDAYQHYATQSLREELTASKETVTTQREITAVSKMNFSMSFDEMTKMNVKLTLTGDYTKSDITAVKVFRADGTLVETITDFELLEDGRLQVTFTGVKSIMMRDTFYFEAYVGEQLASDRYGYSMEAYAKSNVNSTNTEFGDMVLKCMYYGDSAASYFQS